MRPQFLKQAVALFNMKGCL